MTMAGYIYLQYTEHFMLYSVLGTDSESQARGRQSGWARGWPEPNEI